MTFTRRLFQVSDTRIYRTSQRYRQPESDGALRLLVVGKTFFEAYHVALELSSHDEIFARAAEVNDDLVGFYFEGIGAGLALKDLLYSWGKSGSALHFNRFLNTFGSSHPEVMYVGMGMTYGRARLSPNRMLSIMDQKYRRFVVDGLAFCRVAAITHRCQKSRYPFWLQTQDRESFDLGVGRCAWFVESGNGPGIAAALKAMPQSRQKCLWQGLGVSMTYAGKASKATVEFLQDQAGEFASDLIEGCRTAYEMRQRGKNPAPHSSDVYARLAQNARSAKTSSNVARVDAKNVTTHL